MKLPITVCVPVLNEEKNLVNCLKALNDFQKVIVIDSGSKDKTQQIAKESGAEVLDFRWDGKFPKKRSWALRNHTFTTPWVLFLDADEQVTSGFIEELRKAIVNTSHVGFWISFTNWFMGSPLRHGDPFRKLALFRVGAGEYEKFPEDSWSHLDMEVHEHPVLSGSIGEIKEPLEHRDYRGLEHYISKHNQYSTWEARRYLWLMNASPSDWDNLNARQRFKYRNLDKWWLGSFYFVVSFFLKKGFLDGAAGYRLARMKRRYFSDIRLKIQELGSEHV